MYLSKDDYATFRSANRQDIREINPRYKILKCARGHDSTNDLHASFDNNLLIGLEHVLTPNIVKKVSMSRQQHRVEVLKEQGRQKEKGIYDPELLACASRRHSVWSMKRTEKILHMRKCWS